MNAFFIISAIICAICISWWVVKSERGARSFAVSALQGLAAMCAVNLTGLATGVTVAVNWYTILSSVILGLPGVIGMLAMNLFLK